MTFTALALILAAGGVWAVGTTVLVANRGWQQRQRQALWKAAPRLEGRIRPGGALRGSVLEMKPPGLGPATLRHGSAPGGAADKVMRLEIELARALPPVHLLPFGSLVWRTQALPERLRVTDDPGFDARFEIRGSAAAAIGELLDAPVRRLILGLEADTNADPMELSLRPDSTGDSSILSIGRAGWIFEHEALVAFVERGFELARVLLERWDRPWTALAERHGLRLVSDPERGLRSLEGAVQGVPVRLSERVGTGGPCTRLELKLSSLPGLLARRAPEVLDDAWRQVRTPFGNPVLDMVMVARCDAPGSLGELFADDGLAACLLEAVHAHPGSILFQGGVSMVTDGSPRQQLEPYFEAGLRLALALRDRMAVLGIEPCDASEDLV